MISILQYENGNIDRNEVKSIYDIIYCSVIDCCFEEMEIEADLSA